MEVDIYLAVASWASWPGYSELELLTFEACIFLARDLHNNVSSYLYVPSSVLSTFIILIYFIFTLPYAERDYCYPIFTGE